MTDPHHLDSDPDPDESELEQPDEQGMIADALERRTQIRQRASARRKKRGWR